METLDWTPEASDPDDCTASVHGIYGPGELQEFVNELADYIRWYATKVECAMLPPLPLSWEDMDLVYGRSYQLIGYIVGAKGGWFYNEIETFKRIIDALPKCHAAIGKDRRWKP
jgi:hypothetical protein